MYDFMIVGAGLYGASMARLLNDAGYNVLVIDKRSHIAGNCYTENQAGIDVHKYGAHIFHTNNDEVWDFLSRFTEFSDYVHTVTADYKGERYSLPFNMNTFEEMWGVTDPSEAERIIDGQKAYLRSKVPANLEEQAISMVGTDIYEKLVRHYTEKQWGRSCRELPSFIIKRLPLRMTYDNCYFNARYQGIPVDGYTKMVERMLDGIEVRLDTDYLANREACDSQAKNVIYTGSLDALYDYCYGPLEYRSLRFENEELSIDDFQGTSVVNYTDGDTEFTRIIEHKWFGKNKATGRTIITREYSKPWRKGDEPFYPVNDDKNNELYAKYRALSDADSRLYVGGRLGDYRYYDMDAVVAEAITAANMIIKKENGDE